MNPELLGPGESIAHQNLQQIEPLFQPTPQTLAPELPAQVTCNLAGARAFSGDYNNDPHAPILVAFGGGILHMCRLRGSYDLNRMAAENTPQMLRSIRRLPAKEAKNQELEWDDLTFQFNSLSFVYADENHLFGYATSPDEAQKMVSDFNKKYEKPKKIEDAGGKFHLIQFESDHIRTKEVILEAKTILSPENFSLHYGDGSLAWHQKFVDKLTSKKSGLSIFEGRPGTGKTFYLRHLMGELKDTHRFYFIPTSSMNILSKPDFIGFWSDQHRHHSDRQFVVILEDSDVALMTRGTYNREQVSAILNLTDGMLADFLKLQIICTINCSASEIDHALLRPGRLLSHRLFNRLNYGDALRLAESFGKKLTQVRDYSIAEVFADEEITEVRSRGPVGFAQ